MDVSALVATHIDVLLKGLAPEAGPS